MVLRNLIPALLLLAVTGWAQTRPLRPSRRPHPAKQVMPAAQVQPQPAPAMPAPPPTPAQMPPSPPQVQYRNGQLSIAANNSTLRDILQAVAQASGARIEIPPSAAGERIFTQLGPGPARDVVASLLSGSPNDYIILGSQNTPGGIASIILTPKQGGAMTAAAQPAYQPPPQQPDIVPSQASDEDNIEPEQPGAPEPTPAPAEIQAEPPAQNETQNPANPQTPQVKTPEQLLQELQRMQQQQQQRQQQQPNGPPH